MLQSHIKNTIIKDILCLLDRQARFPCFNRGHYGSVFQALYESRPVPKYTQSLPQDNTLVESSGSSMVHFLIEMRSERRQAEYRQLEQKETANLQLRRGGARTKQNKAIAEEGTWTRKAETEDYTDKARAREPGGSSNSTKPEFIPGILNHHLSTTNTLLKTLSADVYSSF